MAPRFFAPWRIPRGRLQVESGNCNLEPPKRSRRIPKYLSKIRLPAMLRSKSFKRLVDTMERFDLEEKDTYGASEEVFNFNRWNHHRKVTRYWRHIAYLVYSKVFESLLPAVIFVMVISALIGVYETLLKKGIIPSYWPSAQFDGGQGFHQISFALSLLLVFRTNTAYDRWWEARKLWGSMTNRTRDLVRQSNAYISEPIFRAVILRWTIALPRVLMWQLSQHVDLNAELQGILFPGEIAALLESDHRPSAVLAVLGDAVASADLQPAVRLGLDNNLTVFADIIGSCERILRTPIPLSYSRHTSRFLLIWVLLLPSMLWSAYGWGTIPVSGLCAFLMLGIDEIGVQIEEPFHVLPVETICSTIERNLRAAQHGTDSLRIAVTAAAEVARSGPDSGGHRQGPLRQASVPVTAAGARLAGRTKDGEADGQHSSLGSSFPPGPGSDGGNSTAHEALSPWDTPRARAAAEHRDWLRD